MLRPQAKNAALSRFTNSRWSSTSIKKLQDAFREPSSPFYLAPGTQGPSESQLESYNANITPKIDGDSGSPTLKTHQLALEKGQDPLSFWEQKVVWGDLDSFQHVNNARYLRFIESSRMHYMVGLTKLLSDDRAQNMLKGKGKSIILKSISVNFKMPVTYPDTLLVALRLHNLEATRFHLAASVYSHAQQREVTTSDSICVWYDYDSLAKCEVPSDLDMVMKARVS